MRRQAWSAGAISNERSVCARQGLGRGGGCKTRVRASASTDRGSAGWGSRVAGHGARFSNGGIRARRDTDRRSPTMVRGSQAEGFGLDGIGIAGRRPRFAEAQDMVEPLSGCRLRGRNIWLSPFRGADRATAGMVSAQLAAHEVGSAAVSAAVERRAPLDFEAPAGRLYARGDRSSDCSPRECCSTPVTFDSGRGRAVGRTFAETFCQVKG